MTENNNFNKLVRYKTQDRDNSMKLGKAIYDPISISTEIDIIIKKKKEEPPNKS